MGRFLLGFVIGAALGAAAVIFTSPRSGPGLRRLIRDTIQGTLDAAREASTAHEEQLWSDFRARLGHKEKEEV
jgi:gas vesicle protein